MLRICIGSTGLALLLMSSAALAQTSSTTSTTTTTPTTMAAPAVPVTPPPAGTLSSTETKHAVDAYGNTLDSTKTTYGSGDTAASDSVTKTILQPAPPPTTSSTTTTTSTSQ